MVFPSPSLPAPAIPAHPCSVSVHPCPSHSSLLHSCSLPAHCNTYQSLSSCSAHPYYLPVHPCPSLFHPCPFPREAKLGSGPCPHLPVGSQVALGLQPQGHLVLQPVEGQRHSYMSGTISGHSQPTDRPPWADTALQQQHPPNPGQLMCPPHTLPHHPRLFPGVTHIPSQSWCTPVPGPQGYPAPVSGATLTPG